MKKSFFKSTIILIVFTLFFVSCWKNIESTTNKQENKKLQSTGLVDWITLEQNAPKVEESISKINENLKEEPSYRACIARSTQMCGSEVISKFVLEKDSDEACNIFEDTSLKISCVNAINTEIARKKIDLSYCDKVTSSHKIICEQQAITAQAIKEKDVTVCNKLKDLKIENNNISGSILSAQINEYEYSSECIIQTIMTLDVTKKDLKICESIKNDLWKQNCISVIKSNIEMKKNTPVILSPI